MAAGAFDVLITFFISTYLLSSLYFQFPAVVCMVNHLMSHTTINADVLSSDEACLVGTEEQDHIGNIHWIADTSRWLMRSLDEDMLMR